MISVIGDGLSDRKEVSNRYTRGRKTIAVRRLYMPSLWTFGRSILTIVQGNFLSASPLVRLFATSLDRFIVATSKLSSAVFHSALCLQ